MSGNKSAILDVVSETTDINSLIKDHDKSASISMPASSQSLVPSTSVESFSTIKDIENLSELNVDENSDLCIKIDNPQKHLEPLETFISFRITTKVARIEFPENEYIVRRRYNDFLWLRHKLLESHPFCIIPPLPAKHSLMGQLDRYSKDFILVRMKALNIFISRVVQHPILSCNEYFKKFITLKHTEFNLVRKQRNSGDHKAPSASLMNSLVPKNKNIEFERVRTYLSGLVEKIGGVEKISGRINKERSELMLEMQYFYPILLTWATTEPQLVRLLQAISIATERCMSDQNELVLLYPALISTPIKDFISYVEVAQEALQKRELFQAVYENSLEDLNKKRADKEKLTGAPVQPSSGFSLWKQQSSDEKLEKLGVCIPQLTKIVESNQDNLECANEQLRSDIERWQSEKQQIVKKILLDFANKHIEYYEKTVTTWEYVRNRISPATAAAPIQTTAATTNQTVAK